MYLEPIVSIHRKGPFSELILSKKAYEFLGKPKEVVFNYDIHGIFLRECHIDDTVRRKVGQRSLNGHTVNIPKEEPNKFILEQEGDKYRLIPLTNEKFA